MGQKVESASQWFALAVGVSLVAGVLGCQDTATGQQWGFDARAPGGPDLGPPPDTGVEDSPDTGTETEDTGLVRRADAIQPDDTGSTVDTGKTDTGRTDTGTELTEEEGWYVTGFEQSEFIHQEHVYPRGRYNNGDCRVRIHDSGLQRERWWASWSRPARPNRMVTYPPGQEGPPARFYGFYEARGRLSPKGEYGHLGGYDREFDIVEGKLDVCRSVSQLGHCVVPQPSQRSCVVMGREEVGRDGKERLEKRRFVRRDLGPGGSKYTLQLDSNFADSWDVEVTFTSTPSPVGGEAVPVGELLDAEIVVGTGWSSDRRYRDVTGWVGRVPNTERETLRISLSGTLPETADGQKAPNRVHVWGAYVVDEIEQGE